MKNITLIILLFLCFAYKASAQNYASSIGVTAGYSQEGVGALVNFNYYVDRFAAVQAGVFTSFANDTSFENNKGEKVKIPYYLFSFQGGYFRQMWLSRNYRFQWSLLGGGLIGYEIVNNGDDTLDSGELVMSKSAFIYGGYVGTEIEYLFRNDDWALVAKIHQQFHLNSDLGNFSPYFGVGMRYFLF